MGSFGRGCFIILSSLLFLSHATAVHLSDQLKKLQGIKVTPKQNPKLEGIDRDGIPIGQPEPPTYVFKSALDPQNNPRLTSSPFDKTKLGDEAYLLSVTQLSLQYHPQPLYPGLFQLKYLVGLSLSCCNLRELPETFGDLKALRFLNLNDNKLQTLPKSFANLQDLAVLFLSRNFWCSPPNLAAQENLQLLEIQSLYWRYEEEFNLNTKSLKALDLCFMSCGNTHVNDILRRDPEGTFHHQVKPFIDMLVSQNIDVYWGFVPGSYLIITKDNFDCKFQHYIDAREFYGNLATRKMCYGNTSFLRSTQTFNHLMASEYQSIFGEGIIPAQTDVVQQLSDLVNLQKELE